MLEVLGGQLVCVSSLRAHQPDAAAAPPMSVGVAQVIQPRLRGWVGIAQTFGQELLWKGVCGLQAYQEPVQPARDGWTLLRRATTAASTTAAHRRAQNICSTRHDVIVKRENFGHSTQTTIIILETPKKRTSLLL